MAWERRGQKRYYYRSRRVGGRVVKDYVGTGDAAALAAQLDAWSRQQCKARREAEQTDRAEYEAALAPLDALAAHTDALQLAVLHKAGYHNHRGEWRPIRGFKHEQSMEGNSATRAEAERAARRSCATAS